MTPSKTETTHTGYDREYLLLGLRIIGEFGAIIAVPVVVLSILGRRLDLVYESAPLFTLAGFIISFALSAYGIHRKSRRFASEYQTIVDKDIRKTKKTTGNTLQ